MCCSPHAWECAVSTHSSQGSRSLFRRPVKQSEDVNTAFPLSPAVGSLQSPYQRVRPLRMERLSGSCRDPAKHSDLPIIWRAQLRREHTCRVLVTRGWDYISESPFSIGLECLTGHPVLEKRRYASAAVSRVGLTSLEPPRNISNTSPPKAPV